MRNHKQVRGDVLVDDIYEYENNEYRIASMQIKAIAYDIVTGITKKKKNISKTTQSPQQENIKNRLSDISDEIMQLTEQLENQLEQLDQVAEGKEITSTTNVEVPPRKEKTKEEVKAPGEIKQPENNTEIQKITPISTPGTENNKETDNKNSTEQEKSANAKEIPTAKEEIPTPRKRFEKTTKNLSKAIMVRPNQLQNLRNSLPYQEKILVDKGIFKQSSNTEITEPIQKIATQPKQLSDEVERQIEDLTVKANIYYNEGEIEKAEELYDKIKELNQQNQ